MTTNSQPGPLPTTLSPSSEPGGAPQSILPSPLTPLLGRDREIADVQALLDGDETRLLTLTGPGGIGKTRLALELAARMQNDFAHGACFVPLATIRDPDLVPRAVAQAFGVQDRNRPVEEVLVTALGARHLLLVLDNMEQVVAAGSWLAELLSMCPRLKALATSRMPLRIRGEQRYPVPPLPLPDADHRQTAEALSQNAAVALFVQRARSVQPSFALTEVNATAVRDICRRLDGLPLAIELAAPRVNILSTDAILARLSGRLAFLTNRVRDVPPRLQTMRNAIAWSHALLSPEEQRAFRHLAVFTGGFTLEAAEAVVNSRGEDAAPVIDLISSLVDQSLLFQRGSDHDGLRFGMLETIREFGLEQLYADDEAVVVQRRHVIFFLDLAERVVPRLDHADHVALMARLTAEQANFRAALSWTVEQDETELGLRMAAALWRVWWVRGEFREGLARLDTLLALPSAAARTIARGRAISSREALAILGAHRRNAEELLHEAIDIADEQHDKGGRLFALITCGWSALIHGHDLERATRYFEQGLVTGQTLGISWACATALHALGRVAIVRGNFDSARECFDAMLAIARDDGNQQGMADALDGLGGVARATGDAEQALTLFREAMVLLERIGERGSADISLEGLAGVLVALGRTEQATRLFGAAAALRRATGTSLRPPWMPMHDADQDRLRSLLGEAMFSTAWAAGEAMTLDEAIAEAISDEAEPVVVHPVTDARSLESAHGLSQRESEVLRLMAEGLSNHEIADTLFISHRTATSHTSNILGKLGLASRTAAVAYAIRNGLA